MRSRLPGSKRMRDLHKNLRALCWFGSAFVSVRRLKQENVASAGMQDMPASAQ